MNDNKSNPIISVDEKRFDSDKRSEDYQAYENLVKETIDYESLEVTHHDDMRQVDEIVNQMCIRDSCMHSYLRAIGFSKLEQKDLDQICLLYTSRCV